MIARYQRMLDRIIAREGGFVNHPADRGGPTNYGITQRTLSEARGMPTTLADVRNLDESEARAIYTSRYIIEPGYAGIADDDLLDLVVDCAVNHGPARATMWLQQAAGVRDDGVLGPVTRAAVDAAYAAHLYRAVLAARCTFYGRLISRDTSQAVFAAGWAARVAEFIEATP